MDLLRAVRGILRDSAFGIVVQLRLVEGTMLLVHLYLLQFEKMMLSRVLDGLQEVRLIFLPWVSVLQQGQPVVWLVF